MPRSLLSIVAVMLAFHTPGALAASKAPPPPPLSDAGQKLFDKYNEMFKELAAEIAKAAPVPDSAKKAAFQEARDAVKKATVTSTDAQKDSSAIQTAKALVEHAKGKWIGGAEKGIAQAQAALKKATTDAERDAANKELAKWQANKEEGLKALKERQAAYDKAKVDAAKVGEAAKKAKETLEKAEAREIETARALLKDMESYLGGDKLDAKLVKCAVLASATPRGLAEFAQQGKDEEALIEKLLADTALMKEMLIAGGAEGGKYGPAMQIYSAIEKASSKSKDGLFHRLALAVSLEHAVPVKQSNAKDLEDDSGSTPGKASADAKESNAAAAIVDPVKRYLHYEKAWLDGELDPAFKNFNSWEYRMVVACDAPDEILAWGRQMLRNYRPDHIYNPDYGWRYSAAVKTEVPYGSQNVKDDLPNLHNYQNIIKDGGICGRRAFFGRFILRSFGIPTWGVTQHKHAALSHWTPKGWLVNLGAGFQFSWWDKDGAPRSGTDFLLETQARAVPQDYLKVLRAQWTSASLGEQAYNDRKRVDGGFWSSLAHYQARAIAADSKAVDLGPLGQDLAEANESKEALDSEQKKLEETTKLKEDDLKVVTVPNGAITIPAAACKGKPKGFSSMKSFLGGMQIHCQGGFKADYEFEAPSAGKYVLSARVATAQEGQKFLFHANDGKTPVEVPVPYTCGMWQQTQPIELSLIEGKNMLHFAVKEGSRGVTIKDITLTPVK